MTKGETPQYSPPQEVNFDSSEQANKSFDETVAHHARVVADTSATWVDRLTSYETLRQIREIFKGDRLKLADRVSRGEQRIENDPPSGENVQEKALLKIEDDRAKLVEARRRLRLVNSVFDKNVGPIEQDLVEAIEKMTTKYEEQIQHCAAELADPSISPSDRDEIVRELKGILANLRWARVAHLDHSKRYPEVNSKAEATRKSYYERVLNEMGMVHELLDKVDVTDQ